MTIRIPEKLGRRALYACVATSALMAGLSGQHATALTEAGQPIQNQATATYRDSLGNDYTSQSNLATVEVRQVYFATLESDNAKTVASNQTVYFQHILTNTGNGEDTYTISVADVAGDDGDFSDLRVYVDLNDNGTVDAGEPEATTVTLNPNDPATRQVSLVVAGLTPTATDGDTFGALLNVTSANGTVTDLTTSKGADGLDNTNQDVATISGDAVLNIIKSSVHDIANNEIDYTITVTNTGNRTAEDVIIYDALPAGTTLVSVNQSGFGTAIDTSDVNAVSADLSETVLSLDLNADGNTDVTEADFGVDLDNDGAISNSGAEPGVYGFDDVLAPGVSIELNFTVEYDPTTTFGAGDDILNRAYVSGEVDGDPNTDDGDQSSNLVTDTVPQIYNVVVSDTGAGEDDTANDGGDDDGAINNTQEVDTVQAGELVYFTHTIQNTGNGTDTFELSIIDSASFPLGTSFTIWNATSTVQLLNTNGEGGVDTGPMASGETLTVVVHAQLPPGSGADTNASYDLVAESSADPSSTPANDDAEGLILTINAPTVDLSNGAAADADDDTGTNRHAYNNDAAPITTETANPGDSVTFPLVIENDSLVADSFQLSAGGSFIGSTLGSLPTGWGVTFRDSSGGVITTTPSIAAGGELAITAEVQIPSIETQAIADRSFVIDGAGNDDVDGNSDSDGDYGIFFRVVSVNSGASDVKLDAVDVLPNEEITLLQNNSGQVQPGGSIDYPHTLQNDGNTTEAITLSAVNGTSGWSNNLLVDTDGDGTADTPFASLTTGGTVYYTDATGTLVAGTLGAGNTLELDPGESLNFVVRTFAPTSAPNGQLDILTVTASYNNGGTDVTNIDRSEVVEAQLRMVKTASVNADCADGSANAIDTIADLGPDGAFTQTASTAAPGECIVWQVVATNSGVDTISNVNITDAVPAFSTYVDDTLRVCLGDAGQGATAACTFTTLSDTLSDDEGEVSAGDIRFTLGQGGAPVVTAGEIASGASVTVRFSTEVE
ncbi:MAG: hypothetical protein AAF216_03275 [Pseudomonadota bacterium]